MPEQELEKGYKLLAEKLVQNPNFLNEEEEKAVRDLLQDYSAGIIIEPENIAYIEEELKTNPLFQKIKAGLDATDAFLRTDAGKAMVSWAKKEGLEKIFPT